MRWSALRCLVGALAALGLAACDDIIFGQAGQDATDVPTAEGFEGARQVTQAHCLGCHGAEGTLGGLDLETDMYTATVGVVGQYGIPIVLAGDPENSMLYLKAANLHPPYTGTDMPPGSGGIDPALFEVLRAWVAAGAPDASGAVADTGM